MFTRVVMLQPMGGAAEAPPPDPNPAQPEVPTAQAEGADAGGAPQVLVTGNTLNVNVGVAASQELCEKANEEGTYATLGYSLAASLVAVVVFIILERKHALSPGGRLGVGVALGAVGASALAFADPARSDQFRLCLNDTSTAVYILLGTQPVARALALGFGPALVLTLVLCVIARKLV